MRQHSKQPDALGPQLPWSLIRRTAGTWRPLTAPRLGGALAFYTTWSLIIAVVVAGQVFGGEATAGQIAWPALVGNAAQPESGVFGTGAGIVLLFGAPGVFVALRDVSIAAAAISLLFGAGRVLMGPASKGGYRIVRGRRSRDFLPWLYYSAQIFFFSAAFTRRAGPRRPRLA